MTHFWAVKFSRQSSGTTVTALSAGQTGFIHFPIPTPFKIDGAQMKSTEATVCFQTSPNAKVTEVKVSDG